jgi:Skp family chaperone for outer membrane proteins
MNKIFISLILSFFLYSTSAFSQGTIAFIDLNYIYSNSKTGKKIIKEIDNKQSKINKDFKDYQNKLDKEKDDLLSKKNVLEKEEFKKRINELENNLIKYQQEISKKNKNLLDFRNKSKNDFAISLRSTLETYAKENKISLILRKEQLLLGESGLDITKEILELFNKG